MDELSRFIKAAELEDRTKVKYPTLEVTVTDPRTGATYLVGPCCFHDILTETGDSPTKEHELAGMGVAIIGNFVRAIKSGVIQQHWKPEIYIKAAPNAPHIPIPWPGMPTDDPIPLVPEQLPFDTAMFLGKDGFRKRIDRNALLDRVMFTWVPALKSALIFKASA